jgi:hypothetical protein
MYRVELRGRVERVGWERVGASTIQDEAFGLQHGTGEEGHAHSYAKGHYLKYRFLHKKTLLLMFLYCTVHIVLLQHTFFFLHVKK